MTIKYTIYMHISPSGWVYIGQTKNAPEFRWQKGRGYRNNPHFEAAIKKYGWDNFEHKILYENLSKSDADKIEIELIAYYKSLNICYNITAGGEGHPVSMSEKQKQQISATLKAKYADGTFKSLWIGQTHSAETRAKMSAHHYNCKGEMNPMYGQTHSAETRAKISKSKTGQTHSAETRAKMSASHKGKPVWNLGVSHSAETRAKMSASHKGKKLSSETIKKLSRLQQGRKKITNGIINKRVPQSELNNYLSQGWTLYKKQGIATS